VSSSLHINDYIGEQGESKEKPGVVPSSESRIFAVGRIKSPGAERKSFVKVTK